MSELRQKQFEFAIDVARLLLYATSLAETAAKAGEVVQFTLGGAYEDQTRYPKEHWIHAPGSLHSLRLAIDINLFVNGDYITGAHSIWTKLAKFWKGLRAENAWGGDFVKEGYLVGDYNHFSRQHGGRK